MSIIATIARAGGAASSHRATAGLCLTAAAALLSGCGSSTGPAEVVTVTVTPTVTAKVAPTGTVPTTATGTARSDDIGRKFDLGTIVSVQNTGGMPVIILDRWTAQGVSDSMLAAVGVPIHAHSDAPYQNLNTKTTYRIPVAPGAVFTYRHCVAVEQPPEQRASTLNEFARLQDSEKVVLLTLNPQGQVVTAQNDPAC